MGRMMMRGLQGAPQDNMAAGRRSGRGLFGIPMGDLGMQGNSQQNNMYPMGMDQNYTDSLMDIPNGAADEGAEFAHQANMFKKYSDDPYRNYQQNGDSFDNSSMQNGGTEGLSSLLRILLGSQGQF